MEYKLRVYTIWEAGKRVDEYGRPHQEDCIFPVHGRAADSDRLFILCDGMGGHAAGEVASETVCDAMSRFILTCRGDFDDDILREAVSEAFNALDRAADTRGPGSDNMGTTMTMLSLHRGGCTIAHVGDSRVYHVRPATDDAPARIVSVTADHSLVGELVREGRLTPAEALTHPRRNVITRAFQPHLVPRPAIDVSDTDDVRPGDYFYLCSDGMLERMDDDELLDILTSPQRTDEGKIRYLRKLTADNSDNHSAILVHILDVIPDAVSDVPDYSGVQQQQQQQEPPQPVGQQGNNEFLKWMLVGGIVAAIIVVFIAIFKYIFS